MARCTPALRGWLFATTTWVVQVYLGDPEASVARPPRELKAFTKVRLQPGQRERARLHIDQRAFDTNGPSGDGQIFPREADLVRTSLFTKAVPATLWYEK